MSYQQEAQFLTSDLHYVMDLDSQLSSHPIIQTVNHPDEITELFDAISYSKVTYNILACFVSIILLGNYV